MVVAWQPGKCGKGATAPKRRDCDAIPTYQMPSCRALEGDAPRISLRTHGLASRRGFGPGGLISRCYHNSYTTKCQKKKDFVFVVQRIQSVNNNTNFDGQLNAAHS